jgi:hypothetical protein
VAARPGDGAARFEWGTALLKAGDPAGALAAFEKASPSGGPAYLLPLRRAFARVALGQNEPAIADVVAAREAGLPPGVLVEHPGVEELRQALAGEPRFQEMLAEDARRAHPCRDEPAYAELDFWVGEWEVVARGATVGHNRIEKILDGCGVMENWRDAAGGEGKSLNHRHPATGRWHQLWIAANGSTTAYEGSLDEEGAMRFEGERTAPGGDAVPTRMSLTPLPGGTVRQVIEESRDGGATWQVGFDAVYRPVAAAGGGG